GGAVPHQDVIHGVSDVQYGAPPSHGHQLSTGFSDFALGDFGPVKHDSVLYGGHDHKLNNFGSIGHGAPIHSDISFGSIKSISHGSVPYVSYGPPPKAYGPPPKAYGPPPVAYGPPPKPVYSSAVVIPLRPAYRPSKGKGGGGGGGKGYWKKFMGMFGK
ncbi:hypothetical protein FHG87_015314, partial [Trinorchestia longiramus]